MGSCSPVDVASWEVVDEDSWLARPGVSASCAAPELSPLPSITSRPSVSVAPSATPTLPCDIWLGGENDGFAAAARTSEGKLRAASYELRAPGTRGAAQRPRRGAAECMSAGIHRVRVPSGKPRAALHGSHGPWDLWDL